MRARLGQHAMALLLGLLWCSLSLAAPVRLCHNQELDDVADAEPAFALIKTVEDSHGEALFSHFSLPWRRCLLLVAAGEMDAALAVSYTPERAADLVFPRREDGEVDSAQRLFRLGYVFLRLKRSAASWNGRRFEHLMQPIGVQRGYSVADVLRELGASVDDGTGDADSLLAKLRNGRLSGIAVSQPHWRDLMQQPERAGLLELGGPALMKRDYFLAFSQRFYLAESNRAQALWRELAVLRESPEFRRIYARHLGLSASDINASP